MVNGEDRTAESRLARESCLLDRLSRYLTLRFERIFALHDEPEALI